MRIARKIPHSVTSSQPHSVGNFAYRARMAPKIKKVLGENAVALSAYRSPLRPNEKGTSRLIKLGLTNGTAQRVLDDESDISLAALETIAGGLRVDPWQLLVPDFHPERLPQLAAETTQSGMANQVARWLDEAPPDQREQLFSLWDSVRGLVAHGMTVQITAGLPAAAQPAADGPATTAKRGRSR